MKLRVPAGGHNHVVIALRDSVVGSKKLFDGKDFLPSTYCPNPSDN